MTGATTGMVLGLYAIPEGPRLRFGSSRSARAVGVIKDGKATLLRRDVRNDS